MTLTKEDVSAVIEKLSRKEFRLGSHVNVFWPNLDKIPMKFFKVRGARRSSIEKAFFICFVRNSNKTQARIAFESDGYLKVLPIAWVKSIGHPILIGDVLEKMERMIIEEEITDQESIDFRMKKDARWWYQQGLLEQWRPLGFTKSLQEILETIEWECKCPLRHADHDEKCFPWIAKPSPATELFEFLVSLFTH